MRREDTLPLSTHALRERIDALGLKQAWLAAQVGVDKKTVTRWVTGRVKRLGRDHAARLATALRCSVAAITGRDEALATRAEQSAAAKLIQERDLLAILAPTDEWPLAESLIRATLQPDLPLASLGRLQNLLAIAAWRQGKYEEAREHAARAREIGTRIGDARVVCGATYNSAVIESLVGDHARALAAYEECLADGEFETPRDRGKVLSNLGCAYRSVGELARSVRRQKEAIRVFRALGLDHNLAIAYVSLGYVLTDMGRFAEAVRAQRSGEKHARRAGYVRGVDCAPIWRADPVGLGGRVRLARRLVVEALPGLARHPVYDLGCHEIAARVFRRAGDLSEARAQLDEGLERARGFPELTAFLRLEEARWALACGDPGRERAARAAANEAFRRAGLAMRVLTKRVREHGTNRAVRAQRRSTT